MLNKENKPLNIKLLVMTRDKYSRLGKVSSRDTFKQNSTEFNSEGLFSTEIFGMVGSKERMTNFGYIDLFIPIIHPKIYKEIVNSSSLYKGIIEGNKYVVFDSKTKDFIEVRDDEGKTGFNVFINHFDDLVIAETGAIGRYFKKQFKAMYTTKDILMDKYLVMPAGLRDYTITSSGKSQENEINEMYRKIITAANSISNIKKDINNSDNKFLNASRVRLQKACNVVYDYIENLMDGKEKFIQGQWEKRAITHGTRNVMTAIPTPIKDVTDNERPKPSDTIMGIYQIAKGLAYITIFQLRTKFLHNVFDIENNVTMLINKKTLTLEKTELDEKTRSRWVTDDGLEELMNKLGQDTFKNNPIVIADHYLYMVYEDNGNLEILRDPEANGLDKKKMRPITYGELFYLALFDVYARYPGYVTRYPITGYGSMDPTTVYLKTTTKANKFNVKLPGALEYKRAIEYPTVGETYFSSMSIPTYYVDALGGDFDGDKTSFNFVWEEESVKEVMDKINSRSLYITPDGKFPFSSETLVNDLIMAEFTE